jgi:hypothetical protein
MSLGVILNATIIGALIAAFALLLNEWLKRQWERKKWMIEKMQGPYLECLRALHKSRRSPYSHEDGRRYLEKSSYLGLMAVVPEVPNSMIVMEAYSSDESAKKIAPLFSSLTSILKALKAHELETVEINGELYVEERGISAAVEAALPVVQDCLKNELKAMRPKESIETVADSCERLIRVWQDRRR